ncbi:MAG: hypothetical protein PHU12_00415 [Candidatus Aenigmarchaeota archaeon]|nr:hypothetical protein [Candidatus Aenigmarchaeota archaeon]
MIFKLLGLLLMVFGLFMISVFPGMIYQKGEMTKTGIYLGVVSFLVGIVMLVFL